MTKQPVSVAGIEFDAVLDSDAQYQASVPAYPIDAGYSVSDNAALDPLQVKMTLYLTATPITYIGHGMGMERVYEICSQLEELYTAREPFEVVTPVKTYDNMIIQSLEIKDSPDFGYAREIPVTFAQVTVTYANAASVPAEYARSGETATSTGAASKNELTSNGAGTGTTNQSATNGGGAQGAGGLPELRLVGNNSTVLHSLVHSNAVNTFVDYFRGSQ